MFADAGRWLPAASLLIYVLLRLAGLANSPEFEDNDSLGYMRFAGTFASLDWRAIVEMNPDATILFPLLTAVFSLLGLETASAARLVSLLASVGVAVAVYLIGRRVAGAVAGSIAVLLLAVNPFFIRFSYSILSEPLYVCIVTFVLLVFLRHYERPTLRSGLLLGLLCGLAFLTRIEGLLLALAIPALQIAHRLIFKGGYDWQRAAGSVAVLAGVFLLLAAPQVLRTSHAMGSFSINGRAVWSVILNAPDGKSYAEKIYGLDYDPGITNLKYLQRNPEALSASPAGADTVSLVRGYASTVVENLETLHDENLSATMGLAVVAFALVGLVSLLGRQRTRTDALAICAFLVVYIAAPLLHNVIPRHIASLGPLIAVLAGAGLVQAAATITGERASGALRIAALGGLFAVTASAYLFDLARLYLRPDNINRTYDAATLRAPAAVLREHAERGGDPPVIVARKTYLGYYADAKTVLIPHTDLAGLLRFCKLNDADFLFIDHGKLAGYPFLVELGTARWREHFELLHETTDPDTESLLSLYQIRETPAIETQGAF